MRKRTTRFVLHKNQYFTDTKNLAFIQTVCESDNMKLTDIQFVRALALVEGLRVIEEKAADRGVEIADIPTEGIKQLQEYVVDRATDYAAQSFPDLSFPDETERETAESVGSYLIAYDASKRWDFENE
jgi:hypothetical protein